MAEEAVPEVLATERMECPVGGFSIQKNDARVLVLLVVSLHTYQ